MVTRRSVSALKDVHEILPRELYIMLAAHPDKAAPTEHMLRISLDKLLVYEPFCRDFGPVNLGRTYRLCQKLQALLQVDMTRPQAVCCISSKHPHGRANAAVALGTWLIMCRGLTAEAAEAKVACLGPFPAFQDASCGPQYFALTVLHCLQGVARAKQTRLLDWHLPNSSFDVTKYDFYEQVENGDWTWIVPGHFIAFSGPTAERQCQSKYGTYGVEEYSQCFAAEGVRSIVRLNKAQYDRALFIRAGFEHHDLYFPDGTCPPEHILSAFLGISEQTRGALAVHCKAGLGRTGTLICCYMMKHFNFSAEEALGYIRIVRPGSILGPQQLYLQQKQEMMWEAGRLLRAQILERLSASAASAVTVAPAAPGTTAASAPLLHNRHTADVVSSEHAAHKYDLRPRLSMFSIGVSLRTGGGLQRHEPLQAQARTSLLPAAHGARAALANLGFQGLPKQESPSQPMTQLAARSSSVIRTVAPNGQPRKTLRRRNEHVAPVPGLGAFHG